MWKGGGSRVKSGETKVLPRLYLVPVIQLSARLYTLVVVLQTTRRGGQDALILPWHGARTKFTDREKEDLMAGLGT
jgi:hypothetical protein